ncbi:lysylphosphatidylglycerol synthase transmembrane domain-containing protein [soil metagenome]
MTRFMRNRRVLLGFVISGVFLYFSLRGQDFAAVIDAFRQVRLWYLVPAIVLYFVGLWLKAYRWSLLLEPLVKLSARTLLSINAVGLMANNVLPLRTGELVRAYTLSQRAPISKSSSLATIAVERVFDGLTMLTFILASMVFVPLTSQLRNVAILATALFAVAIAGLLIMARGGIWRDRVIRFLIAVLPDSFAIRATRIADSFIEGLGIFRNLGKLGLVGAVSLLAWTFEVSVYFTVAKAFGGSISAVMGIPEAFLTTGIANLATLVPSSPGYVGPFEAAVILVLRGALGLTRELALSYAILVHALLYFPVTIWGAIAWSRLHLSVDKVEDFEQDDLSPAQIAGVQIDRRAPGGS